ncbi:MAG: glycerol kinase GlpK [Pseudomonadales bacterium]|nr:glycerol kinase GlpK [Pseudomonadales bacterium]
MSIDQGTSSSRVIIFDETGTQIALAQEELESRFPKNGWVEQCPEELWGTTLAAGRRALEIAGLKASEIMAMGITNQRETSLLWNAQTGDLEYPAIVWQDRRTATYCQKIHQSGMAKQVSDITGLLVDPYFSSTKLVWLLHQNPNRSSDIYQRAIAGELKFGTVDTYLVWRFTMGGSHKTDATNASRTQLFDIRSQQWSAELLDYFDIPQALLAEVCDSADNFGVCDARWFGAEIPITGVVGDQQAALIGQGCVQKGMVKSTYGTGCFMVMNTGQELVRSRQQLLSTVAYRLDGTPVYALEGSIFVAGSAIKWIRDQLGLITQAAEAETAAQACNGETGGVYLIPAFTGLGAPHWNAHVRGMLYGLSLDTTKAQIITATLQSVAFQTQELLNAMAEDNAWVTQLRIDGGMVVNDWLCQFLADILNIPVERPRCIETTAFGVAILAGIGTGLFKNLDHAVQSWVLDQRYSPLMETELREKLIAGWGRAMRCVLSEYA